jgi:integrase
MKKYSVIFHPDPEADISSSYQWGRRVWGDKQAKVLAQELHRSITVRRAAGLEDVRFHDLRHTAATRLVGAHIPLSEVGRVLGHTQANTTYRYVNANIDTARRAAAALDAFNDQAQATRSETDSVN